MNLENKKRYILSLIVAVLVVISLGTYAWLTYRTNDTAMILTIGDINNVRITMNPYQIDANLSPNLTYTGQPYTTVEVVNNSSEPKGIKLYYTINAINSELATSNLKYTIEKKAVGESSYTHITPDGNFAGATKGDIITVIDEEVPVGTTYYKVYVWLYSASSAQNNVTGKRFNAELGADIGSSSTSDDYYIYTVSSKPVTIGQPIPSGLIYYYDQDEAFNVSLSLMSVYMCLKHRIENGIVTESYVITKVPTEQGRVYALQAGLEHMDQNQSVIDTYNTRKSDFPSLYPLSLFSETTYTLMITDRYNTMGYKCIADKPLANIESYCTCGDSLGTESCPNDLPW